MKTEEELTRPYNSCTIAAIFLIVQLCVLACGGLASFFLNF